MRKLMGLFAIMLLVACANEAVLMKPDAPSAPSAATGTAALTFLRTRSGLGDGNAVTAAVYDISDGTPQFIGLIPDDRRLTISAPAGKRRYMVYGLAVANFMEADLSVGKAYYTQLALREEGSNRHFSFRPFRNNSPGEHSLAQPKFTRWVNTIAPVENSEGTLHWAQQHQHDVAQSMTVYWPQWQGKSQAERAQESLNAEDFAPNFQ